MALEDMLRSPEQERALAEALLAAPDAEIRLGLRAEYRGWYSSDGVLEFCPAKSRWTDARKRKDSSPKAHAGIDLFALPGTPITSITSGYAYQSNSEDLGNVVCVRFKKDGRLYLLMYAHLSKVSKEITGLEPKKELRVRPGVFLGEAGNTGNATGGFYTRPSPGPDVRRESHVHLELRLFSRYQPEKQKTPNMRCIDPAKFLQMDLRYANEDRSFKLNKGKWLPAAIQFGDPACSTIPDDVRVGSLLPPGTCS